MRIIAPVLAIVVTFLSGADRAVAQLAPLGPLSDQGDHAVFASGDTLQEISLPRGPLVATRTTSTAVEALAFAPDGRLIAARRLESEDPVIVELSSVGEDGELSAIGTLEVESGEAPLDLAFDREGRLFLLTSWLVYWNPPDVVERLFELDPETGAVLSVLPLDKPIRALATAPEGLWAVGVQYLYRLYPSVGLLVETGISLPDRFPVYAADTDSTGALWLTSSTGFVTPPFLDLWRLDPASGSLQPSLIGVSIFYGRGSVAIRRQCVESTTTRCLQGGRFRARVRWRNFDQNGPGRAAPSHSADSALFWFFSPANWEFLVKVLDGCDENGHFWVLTAAATDVAYTLRVTDLESGQVRIYEHAGGGPATAVTDTTAFATCP